MPERPATAESKTCPTESVRPAAAIVTGGGRARQGHRARSRRSRRRRRGREPQGRELRGGRARDRGAGSPRRSRSRATSGRTDQIDALVDAAYSAFGRVDIVVNNAAMSPGTQLAESSPELFQKTYATNTLGPMWLASRCAERMREHGGGVIVNVVTTGAFRPGAGPRPVLLVEGGAPRAHARDGQGVGGLGRAGQRDRARARSSPT